MHHQMTQTMANRLYEEMRKKGLSSNDMCKILNVKYPAYINAVQGKAQFFGKWQKKICEVLGVEREILFKEFYQ